MNIGDIVNALKEFFLDILGYLIPGMFFIIIMSVVIGDNYKFSVDSLGSDYKNFFSYLLFFWAYIIGYVLYPLSEFTDKILFKVSLLKLQTMSDIDNSIALSDQFELCKLALTEIIAVKNPNFVAKGSLFSPRDLRSVVMSYIPEADTKIYTFMFRSEICKNVGSSSFFSCLLILLFMIIDLFFNCRLLLDDKSILLLMTVLLLISSGMLIKTRMRFYSIAQRIPFTIFIAKYYKI